MAGGRLAYSDRMRVLVVGAGVIGVAVAEALAAGGAEVTVIEMRSPGRGASQASAGVLAPYTEAHGKTTLLELCARSLDQFDQFLSTVRERSGRAVEYSRTGTIEVALTAAEAIPLQAAHAWLNNAGVASEWMNAAQLRSVEPAVSSSAVGGLLIGAHGFVQVSALVAALVQSARFGGATFKSPVEAVGIDPRKTHVDVRAGARSYQADHVVVAAGSWSRRVRVAGQPALPVRPIRGQLLHLTWAGGAPPARIVWGSRCYTVPWADGSLLVGATVEDVGFDEASTVDGVRTLTDAVAELLPGSRAAAVGEVRVGLRPETPDGLPIIGPSAAAPNVTFATGHYRNGILLTPLTAELVSRYVLEGVIDPAMVATSPDRFGRVAAALQTGART
jgi:glycine oxidase